MYSVHTKEPNIWLSNIDKINSYSNQKLSLFFNSAIFRYVIPNSSISMLMQALHTLSPESQISDGFGLINDTFFHILPGNILHTFLLNNLYMGTLDMCSFLTFLAYASCQELTLLSYPVLECPVTWQPLSTSPANLSIDLPRLLTRQISCNQLLYLACLAIHNDNVPRYVFILRVSY